MVSTKDSTKIGSMVGSILKAVDTALELHGIEGVEVELKPLGYPPYGYRVQVGDWPVSRVIWIVDDFDIVIQKLNQYITTEGTGTK